MVGLCEGGNEPPGSLKVNLAVAKGNPDSPPPDSFRQAYVTVRNRSPGTAKPVNIEGLLLVDIMPHGTTINSDGYVATLKKLQVRLSRVRRHREKQDVLLLHDNAQPYVSHKTTDQIRKFG
ncbi:hypothetical protein ANN_15871 [Periplaneta americana]|uniref:Mariner Mos1 transposase n=1 Tax=Periplaneta americana TaxID=6978 RepID=A0ABQ8SIL5_PERAM|nr:hypothetical protein ANN_15871 [Periplaneta americana]